MWCEGSNDSFCLGRGVFLFSGPAIHSGRGAFVAQKLPETRFAPPLVKTAGESFRRSGNAVSSLGVTGAEGTTRSRVAHGCKSLA